MSIVLVGLNHRTAPVELREQLALTGCGLQMALEELQIQSQSQLSGVNGQRITNVSVAIEEAVILSTCNRLEIYAVVSGEAAAGWADIEQFLVSLQGIPVDQLHPHLYFKDGRAVVHHLMRVASGLDSLILGEPQVLGQVAQAFNEAQTMQKTGPILSRLFAQAVHAGKRAHTETGISRYTTSVSHAAALLAQDKLGDLSHAHVLVVGAGEMAILAAQALQMHGAQDITCINRTYSKAEELARQFNGRALNWYHLADALTWADVVVSATGAPHIVIYNTDVSPILPQREGRPLMLIDIAVPRDIEESVHDLSGVYHYNIDDLEAALDANLAQRQAAIPQVEHIVEEETASFLNWLQGRQVAPVITDLRRKAEAVAQAEVELALQQLKNLSERDQQIVSRMAHRIVHKLLHDPTMQLKTQAANGNGYDYAHIVRELFVLGEAQHETVL